MLSSNSCSFDQSNLLNFLIVFHQQIVDKAQEMFWMLC